MNGQGVQAIANLAGKVPFVLEIAGRKHIARPAGDGTWEIEEPEQPSAPIQPLLIHTLDGFTEYVKRSVSLDEGPVAPEPDPAAAKVAFDELEVGNHAVHVVNEREVVLLTCLDTTEFPQRHTVVRSSFEPLIGTAAANGFKFGQWLDLETFVIGLQTLFEPDENTAAVLKVVGNIRSEQVAATADDGVSQEVILRAGVARNMQAVVPNPVVLAPFRTFREVQQPASKFVLRARPGSSEGQLPTVALFEADGGAWRLHAIEAIALYLSERLPEQLPVFA